VGWARESTRGLPALLSEGMRYDCSFPRSCCRYGTGVIVSRVQLPLRRIFSAVRAANNPPTLGSGRGEILSILTVHDKGCCPAPVQLTHPELYLGELLVVRIDRDEL
jgi:hypothetical protein